MLSKNNPPRHFTSLGTWSNTELAGILDTASHLKRKKYRSRIAEGNVLGLLFLNPSLRTKVSFEAAAIHLGASVSIIQPGQGSWSIETEPGTVMNGTKTEYIKETMQVLSTYCDAIGVRIFSGLKDIDSDATDAILNRMTDFATVPVINLESAYEHPCQGLADWLTLHELFGKDIKRKNIVLTWAPHPNPLPSAVPNTFLEVAARSGANVTLACPQEMVLNRLILETAKKNCQSNGSAFSVEYDQDQAFKNADIIYAKSWASSLVYKDPDGEAMLRTKTYKGWTVTQEKMERTHHAYFMHCLPVRRNVVVSDAVLDGDSSVHIQQAENRLHIQKALLMKLWDLAL